MENQQLELFKAEFTKWQNRFGLTGYKFYFKYEPLNKSFADITINQTDMVATVRLNSKSPTKDKPFRDIEHSAKHEAIHLLIGRLELNARYRYTTQTEIFECIEELVHRLENLIS